MTYGAAGGRPEAQKQEQAATPTADNATFTIKAKWNPSDCGRQGQGRRLPSSR